jgi:hypothetical protein
MTESFHAQDRFDIQVALKIIRHISAGIYRDRAGSLRELISNSFDAQATKVRIDTGFPKHDVMTVWDNGLGISAATVRKAFTQVGLSLKVTDPDLYKSDLGRPTIGRFGIGFLAAAHISRDIWIRSFPKTATANKPAEGVEVHVDLEPYFLYQDKIETFDEFKFGTVEYRNIQAEEGETGTKVELRGVAGGNFHHIITKDGQRFVRWPARGYYEKVPGAAMKHLVEMSQRRVNLLYVDRLHGREEILWHIGMTAPVRYLDDGPIRSDSLTAPSKEVIDKLRKANEELRFEVWIDGIEVRKPILLPTRRVGGQGVEDPDLPKDVLVSPVHIDGKSDRGRPVKALGYLFYQPWRIVPYELRGLYPRMKGVGIGYTYENRFLSGLKAESPILRVQVSGELYVLEGLDDALNLDRSGFMELDPEYAYLAQQAGDQVRDFFQKAKRTHGQGSRSRKAARESEKVEKAFQSFLTYLSETGIKAKVELQPEADVDAAAADFETLSVYAVGTKGATVLVDKGRGKIFLTTTEVDELRDVEIVLAVDAILDKYAKDPARAKQDFANQLDRIADQVRE